MWRKANSVVNQAISERPPFWTASFDIGLNMIAIGRDEGFRAAPHVQACFSATMFDEGEGF